MLIYDNGLTSEHSCYLREFFDIGIRGVDYYTPNNIAIEFKETFSNNPNSFFKVYKNQLIHSDLIVFCIRNEVFFVHRAQILLNKYPCNNKTKRANLRHPAIRKNYVFKTNSYVDLKNFLDNY